LFQGEKPFLFVTVSDTSALISLMHHIAGVLARLEVAVYELGTKQQEHLF